MTVRTVALAEGLDVSALGYGAMSVAPVYGPVDPAEALATLHHSIDIGVTFLDTANVYGNGGSEKAVGEVVRTRRDEVQLATKFGLVGNVEGGPIDLKLLNKKPARAYLELAADLAAAGGRHSAV